MFLLNKYCKAMAIAGAITLTMVTASSWADSLIPSNSGIYYKIGGGDVTPLPYDSGQDVNLHVGGNASLGFNCGAFNPLMTIMDSINGFGQVSWKGITQTAEEHMRGVLAGEVGVMLAKGMPNVYKWLTDGINLGQGTYNLHFKSCQTMWNQAGSGQNPNANIMDMNLQARQQDWKYHMSLAGDSTMQTLLGAAKQDIQQVSHSVSQDDGKKGVQWVQGVRNDSQYFAGGDGQPPIRLTFDTVVAGYNVLVGDSRPYNDQGAPTKSKDNQGLVGVFDSPLVAAKWAEYVIGENQITTYNKGKNTASPGRGLLHFIQVQSQLVEPILAGLVTGSRELTLTNLKLLDSPKITISPGVIRSIQAINDPTMRAIWVNRIAQGIAANRVMNKAQLIKQLLLVGSQVPAISSNTVAQKGIAADIKHLDAFISSVRQGPSETQEFLSNSITGLIGSVAATENANASVQPNKGSGAVMQNGAIKEQG